MESEELNEKSFCNEGLAIEKQFYLKVRQKKEIEKFANLDLSHQYLESLDGLISQKQMF